MCNLYSITTNQEAIRALFRVVNRYVGNLAPMPGVFPDYPAPVVRNTDTGRELSMMRWGMPPPRTGGPPVTNIRNTSSPHWRRWLSAENRCLVPANSFAEYASEPNPETKKKDVVWFALNDDRPLFAFAGMWTTYNGDRGTKSKPVPGPHQVYGFLTTSPNAVVEPIHPKAMPVILTTDEEREQRLLRAYAYEPILFASAEAFKHHTDFDTAACVILDINLIDGSGIELRQRLKAAGVSVPVIYMSGNEDPAVRKAVLDSGCIAFLTKPFSAQSLIEPLKKASAGRS